METLAFLQDIWKNELSSPLASSLLIFGTGAFLIMLWIIGISGKQRRQSSMSTKARLAKSMKHDFDVKESQTPDGTNTSVSSCDGVDGSMEIAQLWLHPIKSIRGCRISSATLTPQGFTHDRKFVLLRVSDERPLKYMGVQKYPEMCLFHTAVDEKTLTVSYTPPGNKVASHELMIPLEPPNFWKLQKVDVNMHSSPNKSYNMGEKYNMWFSERFGFEVILAYWGGNPRPVLGNIPGRPTTEGPRPKTLLGRALQYLPVVGSIFETDEATIAFNDCAPYLVITEESAKEVSSRLPNGVEMDISKFRANIVLKGSSEAFVEDFWGELTFGGAMRILLTGNCARCISLNVDYETGQLGTGRAGEVLKLLTKDRRVDLGAKYSPVFGRYGFVSKKSEGNVVSIGDRVEVSQTNDERTRFYWPGLST